MSSFSLRASIPSQESPSQESPRQETPHPEVPIRRGADSGGLAPGRVAVIGSGISGNVVAHLLASRHDVTLYEAADYPGGHTRTVDFEAFGQEFRADTGFMVFNERTYPNFCRLLRSCGVPWQDSDMSFSVRCDRSGLEYQGSGLNGLFAQRRNLLRPSHYRMLSDVVRFNRQCLEVLSDPRCDVTMGEYLALRGFGEGLAKRYLVPMASAIWSCPPRKLLEFPARFLVAFFRNHGLLQLRDRPQWKTVTGGARSYVQALLGPLGERVRLNCPVQTVQRQEDQVLVTSAAGTERYDYVVLATHADQTLRLLADPDPLEREVLEAFPYQKNEAVLHVDRSLLPRRRRAWASWNYHLPVEDDLPVAVSYDLNRLQKLNSPHPILLTLNPCGRIRPECVIRELSFEHPVYHLESPSAQARHEQLNGRRRTWFCGAYWGYGFHEDGVNSALTVARSFGTDWNACTAASTKATSGIGAASR